MITATVARSRKPLASLLAEYLLPKHAASMPLPRHRRRASFEVGRVEALIQRFPALLGPLDAATALLARDHPLRSALLKRTALLEATPAGAEHFLPRRAPLPWLLLQLGWLGARAIFKLAIGIPLLALLRWWP